LPSGQKISKVPFFHATSQLLVSTFLARDRGLMGSSCLSVPLFG